MADQPRAGDDDSALREEFVRITTAMVGLSYRVFLGIARKHALRMQLWRAELEIGAANAS